jgi:Phosphodiester glycosidase
VRGIRITTAWAAAVLVAAAVGGGRHADAGGPAALAVWRAGAWREFWRSDRAPGRWDAADPSLNRALEWRRVAPGLEWAEARLACAAPVWRARLIVARLDPRVLALTLDMDLTRAERLPAWSIDRAPRDALLAVNAGQFTHAMPWGWVVIDGRERLRPGRGPLTSAVSIDASGGVHWSHGDRPVTAAGVVTGFQSYPTLLQGNGAVPPALRTPGNGVDLSHRDARLALGETRDGHLLIAMTRFDVVGRAAGGVPLGPTTPEMAAILGGLGASDAVMLDGGISAQLLLRDPARPKPIRWTGMRAVPLALIVRARAAVGSPGTRSGG